MRALILRHPPDNPSDAADAAALQLVDAPEPQPAAGGVLVRVAVCAVCRTDLDLVQGRITAPRYPVIPGHQVVGRTVAAAPDVTDVRVGSRVGVAWIHSACGRCRWCLDGRENLCVRFRSTGCDADGGYAELLTVPAAFTHAIPSAFSDAEAAPLLCAGAIGWRSLRLARLPDGEPLGLTGFGASAHLVIQFARHLYARSPVFVFARSEAERRFARKLGAAWAGDVGDTPPARMAAVIDTTPAWKPMVSALAQLEPGGRLVVNAIRKSAGDQQELTRLDWATHLWMEREIKSVANVTRADVREALDAAARIGLRPTVREVPLDAANAVLADMAQGTAVHGATVLRLES